MLTAQSASQGVRSRKPDKIRVGGLGPGEQGTDHPEMAHEDDPARGRIGHDSSHRQANPLTNFPAGLPTWGPGIGISGFETRQKLGVSGGDRLALEARPFPNIQFPEAGEENGRQPQLPLESRGGLPGAPQITATQ